METAKGMFSLIVKDARTKNIFCSQIAPKTCIQKQVYVACKQIWLYSFTILDDIWNKFRFKAVLLNTILCNSQYFILDVIVKNMSKFKHSEGIRHVTSIGYVFIYA